jgi:hypothetical protein
MSYGKAFSGMFCRVTGAAAVVQWNVLQSYWCCCSLSVECSAELLVLLLLPSFSGMFCRVTGVAAAVFQWNVLQSYWCCCCCLSVECSAELLVLLLLSCFLFFEKYQTVSLFWVDFRILNT